MNVLEVLYETIISFPQNETFMVLYETFDFYKSFTSFLENLEQQFQWLKIVRTKNKYYYSNIWYFNTMNWIEQKHSLELLYKKGVFKNFIKFSGIHLSWKSLEATESPLKMMKNAFYSTQKLFSFSRYLSFCLQFLVMYRSGLIKKIRLISNFMTSQPG